MYQYNLKLSLVLSPWSPSFTVSVISGREEKIIHPREHISPDPISFETLTWHFMNASQKVGRKLNGLWTTGTSIKCHPELEYFMQFWSITWKRNRSDMWSMWCMLGNPPCLYFSCLLCVQWWLFSKRVWPWMQVQGNERNPHTDTKQMASPLYILYSLLILNSFHCFRPYGRHCCDMLMIKHLKPVLQRLKDRCEQAISLKLAYITWNVLSLDFSLDQHANFLKDAVSLNNLLTNSAKGSVNSCAWPKC